MPYSGTIIFHSLQAALAFFSVLYLFSRRENFRLSPFRKYFTWFFLFVFYNAALIVSALFYDVVPALTGVGYQIALIILAFAAWQAYVAALELLPLTSVVQKFLTAVYILGALLAILLHAMFFEVPQTLNTNWILWHSNQLVAVPYILFMFVAGWTFSFTLARAFFSTPHMLLKIRALFMAASGFILPFAAPFYFAASSITHLYISLGVVVIGLLLFLIGNLGVALANRKKSI